jgi:hypothetical protein
MLFTCISAVADEIVRISNLVSRVDQTSLIHHTHAETLSIGPRTQATGCVDHSMGSSGNAKGLGVLEDPFPFSMLLLPLNIPRSAGQPATNVNEEENMCTRVWLVHARIN